MSIHKNPDVWMELNIKSYPEGDVTTYTFSTRAMAFPTIIQGRVVKGGWTNIDSALSDWRGSREASVVGVTLEDADGIIRDIAEDIGVTAYAKAETSIKLLSEEGRIAALAPRIIHRGFLTGSPIPKSGRKASVQSVDVIGSRFFALNPEETIQKVFFSKEFLEFAGFTDTPKETIDKPPFIIIGEQTDEGFTNANGEPADKGTVPVIDLGNYSFTGTPKTIIPAPVLEVEVVGDTGSETFHYAVSFVTPSGETTWSNVVTVTNSLPNGSRNLTNYNRLTWRAPDGEAPDGRTWHEVYTDFGIITGGIPGSWFRVGGRSTNPPATYLDAHSGGTGVIGDRWFYNDGEIHDRDEMDVEKPQRAPEVGGAYIGDSWACFCWALGYSELTKLYGSDVADQTAPRRVTLDFDHPDLLTPKSAAWPFADPWVEFDHPPETPEITTETVRLSVFFAKEGALTEHHRNGTVTFALNCCGLTDTGDDTGIPISEAGDGYALMINEFVLKNQGKGYRTGDFWPIEEYSDGTPILEMDVIRTFQNATIGFIGDLGYQINLILDQPTTISQFEQWFCQAFNCYVGSLDNGQQGLWVIDDTIDVATARHLRQHIELTPQLADPTIAEDELENKIVYKFHYDADAGEYLDSPIPITNPVSISLYGLRTISDTALELRATAHGPTAADAMYRRMYHNSIYPLYQPVTTAPNPGYELNKGSFVRVTHPDGIGINGYDNHSFFIIRKRFILNKPYSGVDLVLRDINNIVGPSEAWIGDETVYGEDWDIMGDDGEFGEMGDESEWSHAF